MAAYIVNEDLLPGRSEILCLPATIRGVGEDLQMLEKMPVVVMEGCSFKCASGVLKGLGIQPYSMVYVPDVMKETGLKPGRNRRQLSENGIRLSEKVADKVREEADRFFNSGIPYQGQKLKNNLDSRFDFSQIIDEELNYQNQGKGIYHPEEEEALKGSRCF
jgi:uncharacterized metal-binding protein